MKEARPTNDEGREGAGGALDALSDDVLPVRSLDTLPWVESAAGFGAVGAPMTKGRLLLHGMKCGVGSEGS